MSEWRYQVGGRMIFGLIVVMFGLALTLDNLDLMDAGSILRWWPVFIAGYGILRLTGVGCRKHVVSGAVFTILGSWLLLDTLDIVDQCPWDLWPLILVVAGIGLVTGSFSRGRFRRHGRFGGPGPGPSSTSSAAFGAGPSGGATAAGTPPPGEESVPLSAIAILSGTQRKVTTQDFRGGEVSAVLGGHELDLRGAAMPSGHAEIELFVWWGGVVLRVPSDWKVSSEATVIMAGIDDRAAHPAGEVRGHLVLKGLVIMGGVEVKN